MEKIYAKMFLSFLTDSLDYLVYLYMLNNNNINLDILNDNELFETYIDNNLENIIILLNEILNKYQIKYSLWNKKFQLLDNEQLYKEYYDFEIKTSRMYRIKDNKEITDMKERITIMYDCVNNEKNHINIDLLSFLKHDEFDSIEDIRIYFRNIYTTIDFPINDIIIDFDDTILLTKKEEKNIYVVIQNIGQINDTWKIIENTI